MRNIVNFLDTRLVCPNRRQFDDLIFTQYCDLIKRVLIQFYYCAGISNVLLQLTTEIRSSGGLSVTFDVWTDASKRGWLALTGHYFHDGVLKSAVMGVRDLPAHHSGEAIGSKVIEILADFQLEPKDVVMAVTDNALVMLKACRILNIARSPCLAHLLQLIVASVFSAPKKSNESNLSADMQAQTATEELEALEEEVEDAVNESYHFADGYAALHAAGSIAATIRNSSVLTAHYLAGFMATNKVFSSRIASIPHLTNMWLHQ